MNDNHDLSVQRRRSLFVWGVFCVVAGVIFLAYALTSLANGRGEFVMPLDDVYIHFQYAKQIAAGQFYVYNPGLPPTSGATSFLYPYVLAVGYLLGFQGLNLGLWAMGVGALALAESMWLVYQLVRVAGGADWLAVGLGLAFGVSGPVSWHFMSGMETGLAVLLTLGTLYGVVGAAVKNRGHVTPMPLQMAALLALIRPEGGLLAVVAVTAVWMLSSRVEKQETRDDTQVVPYRNGQRFAGGVVNLWMLIPIIAVGVQPVVNLLLTGSAVASGNAAKSVFGMVPFYWDVVIRRIVENFGRMWAEFGTGSSPREGLYITPLLLVLAIAGIVRLLRERQWRPVGLMLMVWLVGGTLMIATLDTAFWHFKRYQMPFMALLFPLGGIGITAVYGLRFMVNREKSSAQGNDKRDWRTAFLPSLRMFARGKQLWDAAIVVIGGWVVLVAGVTAAQFLGYYGLNVGYVYQQPLQMARWLAVNTPTEAVVAVHDVGMMRYMGGRTTLDMVGLTTRGAADYWRNGPGAVAEFLMQQRPDYIASYGEGHGLGLGMIAETSIYGQPLASFPVELENNANVALAADFQGIYKPEWEYPESQKYVQMSLQPYAFNYWANKSLGGGSVNVANLFDEARNNYRWQNGNRLQGFPTEVHEFDYISCAINNCRVTDGGRLISDEESFDLWTMFDSGHAWDIVLVTRLNPAYTGTLDVYANDLYIGTRWIPEMPGKWLEVATCIPRDIAANSVTNTVHIRIVPHVDGGYYMPYYHWIYGCPKSDSKPEDYLSTFQGGAIQLGSADIGYQPDKSKMAVKFEWYTDGSATGDYKVFVHLYDDINQPPVAQTDMRPGNGALPPGNWLPGVLRDTITVDLQGVEPGRYQVAIGMYDPVTFERLQPTGGDANGRLFIGEVEITE